MFRLKEKLSQWCVRCARPRSAHGERHPNAKLTDKQVAAIRREYARGTKVQPLADKYGVSYTTVWAIVNNVSRIGKVRDNRKLTTKEKETLHERLATGATIRELARDFGVTYTTVWCEVNSYSQRRTPSVNR